MPQDAQKMGLASATIICINAMIGSGIFTAPAALSNSVGPVGIFAYVLVIFGVWCMAQSFARLAHQFPHNGSFYTYTASWAGHIGGLITSFFYIIGLTIAMGLLVHVASNYLQPFFLQTSPHIIGTITLLLILMTHLFGMSISQWGQNILIICTLFPLLALTSVCFWYGSVANLTPFAPHGWSAALKATRMVIFGFFGFEFSISLFSNLKNPDYIIPRALSYSVLFVGILYIAFIMALLMAAPQELLQNTSLPLSKIIALIFPGHYGLELAIQLAIISAIVGTIHAIMWTCKNLLSDFYQRLIHKDQATLQPSTRLLLIMLGIAVLTIFNTVSNIDLFFCLAALFMVTPYILAMTGLLFQKDAWISGFNFITSCGMITACLIVFYAIAGIFGF